MSNLDLSGLDKLMNPRKRIEKHTEPKNKNNQNTKRKAEESKDKKFQSKKQDHMSNNKRNSSGNKKTIQENPDIVYAPYNFVPLWEETAEYAGQVASQDVLKDELLSGEITYELQAVTDIFIDNGAPKQEDGEIIREFYKDSKGRYVIPGSTMRGLIRSNAQILSLSALGDDIDDYALMYRDVTGGIEQEKYKNTLDAVPVPVPTEHGKTGNLSILKNVKSGYLVKEKGDYYIYRTAVDSLGDAFVHMNYYVISERQILDEYAAAQRAGKESRFSYLVAGDKLDGSKQKGSKLQHLPIRYKSELDRIEADILKKDKNSGIQIESKKGNFVKYYNRYRDVDKDGKIKYHYRGRRNNQYYPHCKPVSYSLKNDRIITAVGEPGKYEKEGYVMLTGPMQEKKAVYIIPQIDKEKDRIKVSPKAVRAFQIDYNKRRSTLGGQCKERKKEYEEFFALPEEGEGNIKPVFYMDSETSEKIEHFGYTPRLRLFYDHTVKDGISAGHQKQRMDYCRAIFGYSNKNESRKSRVSFSDAVVLDKAIPSKISSLVLSGPKTTFYYNYLEQEEGSQVKTYNAEEFRLRGVKQYHLKKKALADAAGDEKNRMIPLSEGTMFRGKVRFRNLRADELGLLLWSMKLEPDSLMNVGKAKAYGYGAVKLNLLSVKEFKLSKAYDLSAGLNMFPYEDLEADKMIEKYKREMNKQMGPETIESHPSVVALFMLKDQTKILNRKILNKDTAYMSLKDFERQKKDHIALSHPSELYKTE